MTSSTFRTCYFLRLCTSAFRGFFTPRISQKKQARDVTNYDNMTNWMYNIKMWTDLPRVLQSHRLTSPPIACREKSEGFLAKYRSCTAIFSLICRKSLSWRKPRGRSIDAILFLHYTAGQNYCVSLSGIFKQGPQEGGSPSTRTEHDDGNAGKQ